MKKQTAVEWLVDKIEKNVHHTIKIPNEYFDQAKTMEKEQIINAWQKNPQGFSHTGQQYFNKTYGGDK